ncbi:DNA mismatch repair protein MSH3 [Fagus crenata]
MDVTFLESENFYPSPVPNSSLQGETQVEGLNWFITPAGKHGTGNKEGEPHEVSPETEHAELRYEEPGNEAAETEHAELR